MMDVKIMNHKSDSPDMTLRGLTKFLNKSICKCRSVIMFQHSVTQFTNPPAWYYLVRYQELLAAYYKAANANTYLIFCVNDEWNAYL